MNAPERASTASAISDEQIEKQVYAECPAFDDYRDGASVDQIINIVRAVLALAAPTTQPATDPQETVLRFAIDVEKMLCAKLGREWSAAGISIVTLIDALASRTPAPAAPSEDAKPIERDEGMDRTYIPLPGGWEVQTQGKGSSFRICDTKSGNRWIITDKMAHKPIERMAREIHTAAIAASTKAAGETK